MPRDLLATEPRDLLASEEPDGQTETLKGSFLPISRDVKTGEVSFDSSAGILGAVIDAITLPADVVAGKVDVSTEQGIQENIGRITGAAAITTPASAARGAVLGPQRAVTGRARQPREVVPEIDVIRTARDAAYQKATEAGVSIKSRPFSEMVLDVGEAMKSAGFNRKIHPKSAAAFDELVKAAGKEQSLSEVDILRQIATQAARSNEANERRMASVILGEMDRFLESLGARSTTGLRSKEAIQALKDGRALHAALRKSETIDRLFERATNKVGANFTAAGFQTALRQEFKSLVQNDKLIRGFSQSEKDLILKVVRGGKVENVLRLVGKFAPRGVVSSTLGLGGGFAVGGPGGAAAVLGVSEAARAASSAAARRSAEAVRSTVRGSSGLGTAQLSRASPRSAVGRAALSGQVQ